MRNRNAVSYLVHLGSNANLIYILATTLQDVRLELAKEEAVNAERGVLPKHKITSTGFFFAAFDIEEQQWVLFQHICLSTY